MKGIQIMGRGLMIDYPEEERSNRRINYSFEELMEPVADFIEDYYWIFSSTGGFSFPSVSDDISYYENKYEKFLMYVDSNDNRFFQKDFLLEFGKYLVPDWLDIYGIANFIDQEEIEIDEEFIENNVEIYFSCIDGAYWEVYARDENITERLREYFPFSAEIYLEDKIH